MGRFNDGPTRALRVYRREGFSPEPLVGSEVGKANRGINRGEAANRVEKLRCATCHFISTRCSFMQV